MSMPSLSSAPRDPHFSLFENRGRGTYGAGITIAINCSFDKNACAILSMNQELSTDFLAVCQRPLNCVSAARWRLLKVQWTASRR